VEILSIFFGGGAELMVISIMSIIPVVAFWKICAKAGFPGALGILIIVPLANIVLVLYLAFADWPALKQSSPSADHEPYS
jgi:hypothetical protein